MASSQDTEITLGTAKLLGLFFGLVIVCAVFFSFGYTLGRKSETGMASLTGPTPAQATSSRNKPASAASSQAAPMTFYKAVEQKDTNAQLTPATDSVATGASNQTSNQGAASSADAGKGSAAQQTGAAPDPMAAALPTSGYFVQVAAVSKQDDAEALVDALKKKQYPAFVAGSSSTDKLFRVQLGPFGDIKEAEGMRSRLINDGYNPILKK